MATQSTERVADYFSPSKSFLINRLFSFSGLIVWGFGLLLIQKGLTPFYSFQISSLSVIEILFFLVLILHFLYGLSWLQGIFLNKLLKSGVYYFSKRLTFLLGFFYLIFIALASHPELGATIQEEPALLYVHGVLLIAFLFYGYASFADFFWDWGLMIRRKYWKGIFFYLGIPFFGFCLFLLGTSHYNWLKEISQ